MEPYATADFLWWKAQVWSNQAAFELMDDAAPGDLSMQGLTVKTGFWF